MGVFQLNIMVEMIFILLHFFVFIGSYHLLNKKISQPAVLFALVWFLLILGHLIFKLTLLDEMDTLRVETYFIFLMGNISFTAGSFIINQYYQFKFSQNIPDTNSPEGVHIKLRLFLSIFLIVALPFYVKTAFDIFIASQSEELFIGIKYEISYGEVNFGLYAYLVTFSYVVFAFNLHAYYKEKNHFNLAILISSLICGTTYAIFAGGRLQLFMVFCIYVGVGFFMGKKISIKKLLWPAFIFLLFFLGAGIIYRKGGSVDDSFSENLYGSLQNLGIYLVSSLNALDLDMAKHLSPNTDGERTFRFFIKLARETGILPNVKPRNLLQDFVFIPYPTNVYTYYMSYILDFGKIYAWAMLFIYGIIHTFFYNIALYKKSLRMILCYSFFLFPSLLSFFDDFYMTQFSLWLQLFLYTEMILISDKYFRLLNSKFKDPIHPSYFKQDDCG